MNGDRLAIESGGETRFVAPRDGETLAEMLARSGIPLDQACGGLGVCGRCRVQLLEGDFEFNGRAVTPTPETPRELPACRVRPTGGGGRVRVPDASRGGGAGQIVGEFTLPPYRHGLRTRRVALRIPAPTLETARSDVEQTLAALATAQPELPVPDWPAGALESLPAALEAGARDITLTLAPGAAATSWEVTDVTPGAAAAGAHYALAADIGTTTVVCALVDLAGNRVVDQVSQYNQQMLKGADVASRISHGRTREERDLLQRLIVVETLNPLIRQLRDRHGLAPDAITRLAVAGNTVMMHLLFGYPAGGIGALPFQPVARRYPPVPAAALGLELTPRTRVDAVPSISGYVGGDIVADLYTARYLDRRGRHLLVDIGTNGEMALWDGERLRVTATAAGPAFEGAGIGCGCRAVAGAIERVDFTPAGDMTTATIGRRPAVGLCGSGLIDFLGGAAAVGWLNVVGRFDLDALRAAGRYRGVTENGHARHACLLADSSATADGRELVITEADVAEALKAKAAVAAGIRTLLETADLRVEQLDKLTLAGGFARHVRLPGAAALGLLPDLPPERFEVVGNGSLGGACLALLDRDAPDGFAAILAHAQTVELNLVPSFEANYVEALMLPQAGE